MPLWMGYDDELEQQDRGPQQCRRIGASPGAIFGALFLKRFVTGGRALDAPRPLCLEFEGTPGPRSRRGGAGRARRVSLFVRTLRDGVIMRRKTRGSPRLAPPGLDPPAIPSMSGAYSRLVVDGIKQAPARAMLHAVGFGEGDFEKPQVGIASTWSKVTPCNMHIDKLARSAAEGRRSAGGKAVIFNTITISDGISMGTPGHEIFARLARGDRRLHRDRGRLRRASTAWWPSAAATRTCPGALMAIARLNRPARVRLRRHDSARLREPARHRLGVRGHRRARERARSPTPSSNPSSVRAIPGPGFVRRHVHRQHHGQRHRSARHEPAEQLRARRRLRPQSADDCRRAGAAVVELIKRGIRPLDIMTRKAFENAITVVIALGGSTNAVLHLLAIATPAKVKLQLDDFTRIGQTRAGAGRSEAERKIFDVRTRRHRRHPAADENAARRGIAPRRVPDRHRRDAGGESARTWTRIRPARTSSSRSTIRSRRTAIS